MITTPDRPKNYSIICNEVAKREDISARAKGIFYYLTTLPYNWKLNQSELYTHFTEGEKALRSAFNELITLGYIERNAIKDEHGKFNGYNYKVNWTAETVLAKNGNPQNGQDRNRQLLNTKEIITKDNNYPNKLSCDVEPSFSDSHLSDSSESVRYSSSKEEPTHKRQRKKEPKILNEKNEQIEKILGIFEKAYVNEYLKKAVKEWLEYKKERTQMYKATGLKVFLRNIASKVSATDYEYVVDAIEDSIANNWMGITYRDKYRTKKERYKEKYPDTYDIYIDINEEFDKKPCFDREWLKQL